MLCKSRAEARIVRLIRMLYRRIVLKANAKAVKTTLSEIQSLRALFLQETNFEIRYNACHERGWADSYLLMVDELKVGYGSIRGQELEARDTVFEFYVTPPFRKFSSPLFLDLISASGAKYVECQSNDMLLSAMLYEFSENISSDTVLFDDHVTTAHTIPGAVVGRFCANQQCRYLSIHFFTSSTFVNTRKFTPRFRATISTNFFSSRCSGLLAVATCKL